MVALAAVAAATAKAPPHAAESRNPDWPCVQAQVPEISLAAVWAGPPLDDAATRWENDGRIRDLVERLSARRVPLEEAQKLAADFLSASGAAREDNAMLLFAGVFDKLNRLRSEVMRGIERYTRRQREFAERIRENVIRLHALQDAPNSPQKDVDELSEQVQWDTRIFEDRRRTINYVCEVPITIERRVFALGRTIQEALE